MNTSYDKNAALVVLPPVTGGRLQDKSLRAWLSQSDLSFDASRRESLASIVTELGMPYPDQGLAALRMWGQTGDRPATLEGDDQFGFTRLGPHGYLSSPQPIATAAVSADVVDQDKPDEYLPDGDGADRFRNLVSEIEMALHDHDINQARQAGGLRPVNSLWLWGGGIAPQQATRPQPPLFSDDALSTGYWYSATAVAEPWLGSIEACLENSVAGFVAQVPDDIETPVLETVLQGLRSALRADRLSGLTLLFRDGLRAHIRRSHALRVWRRTSHWLAAGEQG